MNMQETLNQIKVSALEQIAADGADLEQIRVKYLGKKGELTGVLRGMGQLSPEERPVVGQIANEVRAIIEEAITARAEILKEQALEQQLKAEKLDVTMPGSAPTVGHIHPLTLVQRDLEDIFMGLGFSIAEGPEVEYDYYNFQALNIPEDHPARDTQDTFYITEKILLRSQTSPVQARVMEVQKPPIRIVSPGRVYRSDAIDATHSPVSVPTTSPSPSRLPRLTFPASLAAARDASCARTRAGSRSWVPAWYTPTCWRCAALTRTYTADLLSDWVLSVLPC